MKQASVILISLALVAGVVYVGTRNRESRIDRATREGILLTGCGAEPQDLDPHTITGAVEFRILRALFEGLTDMDRETMTPIPGVAAEWTVSNDEKTYTFRLRRDAKWSNGDPVTAHDFVYGCRRILSPALGAQYAFLLYCVDNAEAYHKGEIEDFAQVGIRALDDYTVQYTLRAPTAYFLSMLIMPCWYPVHRATIERFGKIDERQTKWTRAGNLVGNGPFVLESWEPNTVLRVVKSATYWDREAVRLNAIHFFPVENAPTEERMFRRGELHRTENVPINKIEVYREANDERLRIAPALGTYFYRFNVTCPPFDDVRVRRALAMAIDRKAIVEHVTKGGEAPAYFFTPPDTAGYTCQSSVRYDLDEARRLLAEAGYPAGEGFPTVELLYNTDEAHKAVAEAIQNMWSTGLNVHITLKNQEWKVYLDTVTKKEYTLARGGWYGDYLDPSTFLEIFTTSSGINSSGYSSAEFDDRTARAARTAGREERYALFQEAEKILLEDMPLIPIYHYTQRNLISPHLKGWNPDLLGFVYYKNVYLQAPDR